MTETHEAILQDLIDEIDNAGACLAAFTDCNRRTAHFRDCGFAEFNKAVASASRRAKTRLAALEAQRASRTCAVCGVQGDADHLGHCSESW